MSPNHVTSRLFLPAKTGKRSFENMNRTMERLDVWLRVTGNHKHYGNMPIILQFFTAVKMIIVICFLLSLKTLIMGIRTCRF